jgi:hypothetical protein
MDGVFCKFVIFLSYAESIKLPAIRLQLVEGGAKGQIIAQSAVYLINRFFELGINNIQDECNKVSNFYRNKWASRASTEIMDEYKIPISYRDGSKELEPDFKLFEPTEIHVKVIDSYYSVNPKVAATLEHSIFDQMNPLLTIYTGPLEIAGGIIIWKGFSTTFQSIITHELLHACGDSPILRSEIHDGVLRHTMVCNEAINNLLSRKI